MTPEFRLFGIVHLAILVAIPAVALLLSRLARRNGRVLRLAIAIFLTVNELVWYAYKLRTEGFRFPDGLPLHLCDLALWMTVIATATLRPRAIEIAYFAGVGGSSQALLTPALWAPLLSYPTAYYFVAHGMVVATPLALVLSAETRLEAGCVWRALASLNAYAVAIGLFNAVFGTNYMYLCRKPMSASLLDFLGPWPLYLAAGEALAVAVFWLLWLPFRPKRRALTSFS
jgi:hypothetical integral membrane protein (TIGR02206 family)